MSKLLQIKEGENRELLLSAPRAFEKGEREIRHLGKIWRLREIFGKPGFVVDTYLGVKAVILAPNEKGACSLRLDIDDLASRPDAAERVWRPRIRGEAKFGSKGEPVVYFFYDEGAYNAKLGLARKLIESGKCAISDFKGILTEGEIARL